MKRSTIVLLLSMALIMITGIGFASDAVLSIDGQNINIVGVAYQGGNLPADIVAGQTNLQTMPATGNYADATVNINAPQTANSYAQQDASKNGSGANVTMKTTLAEKGSSSSGGNSFHAGKNFVASTPIEADGSMMTSIAT